MSRTILVALALIGLAACGGGHKQAARGRSVAAGASRSPSNRHQTAQRSPSRAPKRSARADTTTQRNPLTNR